MKQESIFSLLVIAFVSALLVSNCKSPNVCPNTTGLKKLNAKQYEDYALSLLINNDRHIPSILDEQGNCIQQDSYFVLFSMEKYFEDLYMNEDSIVTIVQIRKSTPEDFVLTRRINDYYSNGLYVITEYAAIDCDNLSEQLSDVFLEDQLVANSKSCGNREMLRSNLRTVVSIIETCPPSVIENLDYEDIMTLFIVIQHSDLNNMEKYIPYFKGLFEKGIFEEKHLALMIDRIRKEKHLPQLYGTQLDYYAFDNSSSLYKVDDIDSVHIRREKASMEPLEEYLGKFE